MSLEKLLRVAFSHRLISDYRVFPGRVQIHQDASRLQFDPEEARFFLRGLLNGYQYAQKKQAMRFGLAS